MSRRITIPALTMDGFPCVYLSDRAPWLGPWPAGTRVWVLMDSAPPNARERIYCLGAGPDVGSALRAAADAWDQAAAEVAHAVY